MSERKQQMNNVLKMRQRYFYKINSARATNIIELQLEVLKLIMAGKSNRTLFGHRAMVDMHL
jgi:hypothetical protein